MDRIISVRTVPLQYGDAKIKCHKIINYENSTGYVSQFHVHKYYECHFIKNGEAIFRMPGSDITLSDGEMLIIPPQTSHFSLACSSAQEHHVFEFSLCKTDESPKGIYKQLKSAFDHAALNAVKVSEALISSVKCFEEADACSTGEYLKCTALLTNIIFGIYERIESEHIGVDLFTAVNDFDTLLDVCISIADMSAENIAETVACSKRNLSRKLKNQYGVSLSFLRDRQCVKTAMKLLEETNNTIEQVAQDSGFKSANAMRIKFKKYTGVTPTGYRNLKIKK